MRLPLIIASILCTLAWPAAASTATPKSPGTARKLGLDIKIDDQGWGAAKPEEIETVLYAVADELMSRLPKKLDVPVRVSHTEGNPIALYERGAGGEYRIRLHASGKNWHLYTYEFAHELCHVLSNYEENLDPAGTRYNQWFEETLCETASLFALKSLAARWAEAPPTAEWAEHAEKLSRFYDLLINEGHRSLPAHAPLAVWLRDNETRMRQDPYLRDKNEVVANLLLPLFQRNPENWDTLTYLNLDPTDARATLQDYLGNWYRNAPLAHKDFIADVLDLFHLRETITAPEAARRIAAAPPATTGKAD